MSIAPVSSFSPDRSDSQENTNAGSKQPTASPAPPSPATKVTLTTSVSESAPKREAPVSTSTAAVSVSPQDVVEVHQDPDIRDQLIVQYVNKAKEVVLQVPSSQELAVQRGIAQDFQHAAKRRASENPATGLETITKE